MPEKDWKEQAEIYRLQLNETAPMLDELDVVRSERDALLMALRDAVACYPCWDLPSVRAVDYLLNPEGN